MKLKMLPDFVDVTPGILNFTTGHRNSCNITLSNLTKNTVVIEPKSILCELQLVSVEEKAFEKEAEESIDEKRQKVAQQLELDKDDILSTHQKKQLREFKMNHKDMFSVSDTDIGQCNSVKHRIDLRDDIPF